MKKGINSGHTKICFCGTPTGCGGGGAPHNGGDLRFATQNLLTPRLAIMRHYGAFAARLIQGIIQDTQKFVFVAPLLGAEEEVAPHNGGDLLRKTCSPTA